VLGWNRIGKCFCNFLKSFSNTYLGEDFGVLYEVFFFKLKVNKQRVTQKTHHTKTKLICFKFAICDFLKAVLMRIKTFPDVTGRKKRDIREYSNLRDLNQFRIRQAMSVRL